ncbi:redoxin domain-containing protein [Methylophaga sp. OBS3]|uniref:redoxin domain-containing protein n=1 Tax=Methylophaga sp. OBS3 TaxID=2991934 RepID=UPI00224D4A29|nr:redoxin domain-containing protein [Methylophaga sp. OBS3]MCX4189743.1 peroxiredoxin family protein [Methylophaga sp. OBS3]
MQDLIKNMHSKRFLLIYLAVVAILLLIYLGQQSPFTSDSDKTLTSSMAYQWSPAKPLPDFMLQDKNQQLYSNADLLGHWHFLYIYDGRCQPQCEAIWQVIRNLAERHAGDTLQFWIIDITDDQTAHNIPSSIPVLFDPMAKHELATFFVTSTSSETLYASLFLVGPDGNWHAGFHAPFTSKSLQMHYLQLRDALAKAG